MTTVPPEHTEAAALFAAEAARAREGSGRLVLLRGATGTGRTTVLEAAAADAAAHGMRVLRARCAPGDAAMPFATVLQLLGTVPEFADLAVNGDERASAARLWRVLRDHAGRSPLLLAVDDVHLADAPSRRWLVESTRHLDRLPVVLAVTERSQYDVGPPATGLAHTLSPALVRAPTLAPLAPGAAAALVRAARPDAPAAWVDACVRAGAGSPLLLRALLDDLAAGPYDTVPATCAALYPGTYAAAVRWWLDSAGEATAEVARALAALDEGGDREAGSWADTLPGGDAQGPAGVLADLAGADPARVAGWLTAATGLGLLRPGPDGHPRYAHPLLRDAVLTGVPAARRRAAHRATAEAMLHRGAPTEAVARRLLLSDPVGAGWAPTVLQDAAALALRDGRAEDAAVFLRRALDEPQSDDRRQRLLTELGSLEYAARRSSAGIPRLTEAVRLPGAPQDRVRAAVALGTALAGRGRARAAVDVLRSVDGQLGDHPDLVRTLQSASALLSDQDQAVRQEVYRWLSDTAERSAEEVGPAGQALLVRHAATAGLTSAQDAMRRVRALLAEPADPLTEPFLVGTAAAVAQWADELTEAEGLVERGLAGQRPDLLHPMQEALLNTRADIAAARGDYGRLLGALPAAPCADADADADAASGPAADPRARPARGARGGTLPSAAEPPHPAAGPTNAHAHAVIALVETGRPARAERLAAAFDLRRAPDNWELNRFLYARGVLRAAAGDPSAALHDFLECGRRQSAREVVSPVVTPWRTAAAQCRLALGDPRAALALAEEELALARVWDTPRTVGRALGVLGTATGGRRGLDLTAEAVGVLRDAPDGGGTELASALVAHGRGLTAAGERARARDCLREAAAHAERLGARRLRSRAEAALREGGARRTGTARTGSAALTAGERRIVELAADGRTNTEIGALLHLARRTVETHLTSSYRKLGIRRRNELRAALEPAPD
ncbi:helix-turn-helix transcriptional regulator [Streptomyces tropicalis]|uniref:AAA family ATPase n=1 Tax=Streptomyces tropicalis TaxID=3034234 RepID=A0ABT6AEA1_9ACTN|nr:AAA family ATPase [Streptomyces tropicalis]MDF3302978.1 AAA family ATPase [Streptomyces tropicalis]